MRNYVCELKNAAAASEARHNGPCSALLNYWSSLAASGGIPAQSAVQPRLLKSTLPHTFILDEAKDPAFRLAGTALCEAFGHELKGTTFLSLWDWGARNAVALSLRFAKENASPVTIEGYCAYEDSTSSKIAIAIAPLRHMADTTRLIGAVEFLTRIPMHEQRVLSPLFLDAQGAAKFSPKPKAEDLSPANAWLNQLLHIGRGRPTNSREKF
ncbi:hypothetical protein GCM10008941_12460 [Rhizomicrobium palustre]|nr:PAS domain-containing protein [Rhizomicrobium palustre]